jgi:hypothetical protein
MNVDRYHLKSDETLSVFEFVSTGPNGAVRKLIHFQLTHTPGVYNLAFGDKNPVTGAIDDLAITNNGDTDKVLGTVVAALYTFMDKNPEAFVYATGSTPARTRLYRMGITRFYEEMQQDFYLFGRIGKEFYQFEVGTEYEAFLAQRKFT